MGRGVGVVAGGGGLMRGLGEGGSKGGLEREIELTFSCVLFVGEDGTFTVM